mgnify:CR=1 FL=1
MQDACGNGAMPVQDACGNGAMQMPEARPPGMPGPGNREVAQGNAGVSQTQKQGEIVPDVLFFWVFLVGLFIVFVSFGLGRMAA